MFNWFILLFALLQGILEWLPVSSQGQTVSLIVALFQDKADLAFQIALWLHLGTTIAVIVKYRKELLLYLNFKNKDSEVVQWRRFLIFSTVGTIITGVPCFLLVKYLIEESSVFGEYVMLIIGVALIVTAALLFYSERKKTKSESLEEQNEAISDKQQ
ncbi:MAG: undecaprenyl-diphosphate phosphatase, partial [Candidatus Heimdallarchaeaceae archaeon]